MKVTHVEDHITHAVIGGQAPIDFSIEDSPEFMQMLSTVLYKNQPLAVVREVLCNAWDAHIEAGKTDTPVMVTMSDKELTFEDFGLGIPHSDMGQRYGRYGRSTKKLDKRSTGGFGLGCKAPFAYTDNFEVESSNQGTSTIYRLSKSNAEIAGKPAIIPIVSFAKAQSGLKVTIPLKNTNDITVFEELIYQIAYRGDMKVHYTNQRGRSNILPTMPLDDMPEGFMLTNKADLDPIMIRYGNVLYPLDSHADYADLYGETLGFLKSLSDKGGWNRITWKAIFQAEPDTISITPSREELSMQAHTVLTIKGLLEKFNMSLRGNLVPKHREVLDRYIAKNIEKWNVWGLLLMGNTLPKQGMNYDAPSLDFINKIDEVMEHHAQYNYPSGNYANEDRLKRLTVLRDAGLQNPNFTNKFIEFVRNPIRIKHGWQERLKPSWFHKMFLWPVMHRLIRAGLDPKKLLTPTNGHNRVNGSYGYGVKYTPVHELGVMSIDDAMDFCKNTVFITYNRDRVDNLPYEQAIAFSKIMGTHTGCLAYVVPLHDPEYKAKAIAIFENMGYAVYDSTIEQERARLAEKEAKRLAREAKKKEPKEDRPKRVAKPKGIHSLSSYHNNRGGKVVFEIVDSFDFKPNYIEKPLAVVRAPGERTPAGGDGWVDKLGREMLARIDRLWPNEVGVVHTNPLFHEWRGKGCMNIVEYLDAKILQEFKSESLELKELLESDYKRLGAISENQDKVMRRLFKDKYLADQFHIDYNSTERARELYYIYTWVKSSHYTQQMFPDTVSQVPEIIDRAYPVRKTVRATLDMVKRSPHLKYIDVDRLPLLKTMAGEPNEGDLNIVRKMLLLVLKG